MTLGTKLNKLRTGRNLTQVQIADQQDITLLVEAQSKLIESLLKK